MKKSIILLFVALVLCFTSFGQISGIKTIPGDYSTVTAAITALNAVGVGSGGVTFNVAAGYTETFPSLTAGLIMISGTASNPIVFKKSGTGANPLITAAAGTASPVEYIFCLQGTDYITFDGIDVTDPSATVEWGYAIFKNSATDGAQFVTIKNCNITLNKTNTATIGIYANNVTPSSPVAQLTVTATSGANSNIKIYSNTIQNCYNGIWIAGFADATTPYVYYDQNNEIGKDGANTISNFGGGSVANNGIYTIYQNNQKIANNIVNGPSAGSGTCSGIQIGTANNANIDYYNNTISIAYAGTGAFYGIWDAHGNTYTGATVMNAYNNTVTNCTYTTAVAGTCYYMYLNGGGQSCNVYNNIVTANTYGSATTTSTGTIEGIYFNGCQNTTGVVSYHNNQVTNNTRVQSVLGAGTTYYLYINGGGTQADFYNNTIDNNTIASNGTCYCMYVLNNPTGPKNIYGNTITNILNGFGSIYGIYSGNAYTTTVYKNKLQNFNAGGAGSGVYGLYLSSVSTGDMICYNNFVGDLKSTAVSSTGAIYGIYGGASGSTNLYVANNTVYLNASSTGVNFGTAGLYVSTSPSNFELKNNIVVNTSTANGTGFTSAFRFTSTTINTYSLGSNNNDFYAGTPGATNVIYYDGTNTDQTIAAFRTRVAPRESQSVTENPPFISTTPGAMNLHINPAIATQVESAGLVVSTPNVNTDYDNDPRYPNTGYPVNASYPPTAPDMGADEFGGIPLDLTGPFINYSPLMNTSILTNRALIATITDMHGVPTTGAGLPRLAWKKFYNGTWTYVTGTSLGANQYSFNFGGGVVLNDSVYYYVLAQDNWTTPNVGTNPAVGAAGFTTSPPAAATAPTTPFKYKIITGICGSFNVGVGQTYATLTAAVADISVKDLTCPVTLVLTDNAYAAETYPIVIPQIPGASATNTLTIKPAAGITPVFSTSYLGATPNYWSMISLNGTQYVIFDGSNSGGSDRSMTFQNIASSGFAAPIGLYNNGTVGASNITVKNCVLQAHKDGLYNAQGFAMYNITGNAGFRNIILNNNSINSAKFGVNILGIATGKAVNIQVTNNTIGSNLDANAVDYWGIQMSNADSVLIEGNEIIGPVNGNLTNPQALMGIYIGSGSTNLKIRKNTFHDWYGGGNAALGIYYGAEANTVSEISDNVMYAIKSPGYNPYGIFVQSGGNLHIYHNSIFLGGNYMSATAAVSSACIGTANNVSLLDIRNNILKNSSQPSSGTPAAKSYAIFVGTNVTGCTYNYNDYFVDGIGPNIGSYGGVDMATLANWQAATAQEANSLNVDPLFTSATNLLPTTATMPHAGTYFTSVPTDINGVNRTNPPDMGAYEFTTNPLITTTVASGVINSAAILNGTANAAGTTFNLFFDWGLTTAYGTSTAALPGSVTGNTLANMSLSISGLTGNTTYHYRARGVTSGGLVVYGSDKTLTTLPDPPAIVTTAATAVTSATATLNGTVNSNGGSTTATFEYGLTTAYGTLVNATPLTVTGAIVTNISAPITGLLPYATYHYRAKGVNAGGATNGNDMTFTTSPILSLVVTNLANPVGSTTATLNGSVTANNAPTTVTFQYGPTVAYGSTVNAIPATANGMTATSVLASLTGLVINSTYHFRCVGVNAAGTTYGADQIFATNCVAPVITITGAATTCSGTAGYVYTTEAGMSGYSWNISAGGTITAGAGTNAITVTWNTPGAQSVSVNYNNTFGCSAAVPLTYNVTVNASPVPTITGSATACVSWTNNTYSTQAGMTGYVWTVSAGGTITAGQGTSAITVTWTSTGAKTVTVNYANASGCLAPSATVLNVTVNTLPAPTITGQNSVCANSGFISYTTETGKSGYIWTVSPGGVISSGQGTEVIQVTWTTTGAQTVSVNYANANGCMALAPTVQNVTVNGTPAAAGAITGTATVCGGAQGIAYSVGAVSGALAYAWTLPAGASIASGANTNAITVNFAGNASSGNITVAGNNLCGNGSSSPNFTLTVNALPAAAGTVTGDASVCLGSANHVYTVPLITNATNYTWTLPAGTTITSGQNSNMITVTFGATAVSGNISVVGANTCGSGTASPNFAVVVHPIPAAPVVTAVGNVLTSSATSGNQWYYEGNAIAGATGQTYTVTHNTGYYSCEVTLSGCSSPVSNKVWVVMTGQQDLQAGSFNIYPVPSDGKFTVSLVSQSSEVFTITVMTSLGVQIREVKNIPVTGRFDQEIDLRPAAAGTYLVVIRNSTSQVVKKIIISK